MSIKELAKKEWDAIVVGAGMGGGAVGYSLAKAGMRILFCEKGRAYTKDSTSLVGNYAESFFTQSGAPERGHYESLKRSGRAWQEITDDSKSGRVKSTPFIGCGTGGSSALYGMAMERLFPVDFRPRDNFPDSPETTLPSAWPIKYDELERYYHDAECLFRVRGSGDPLRREYGFEHLHAPPEMSPGNQQLFDFLSGRKLHPYRLPVACEFVSGCQFCQGYLCPNECKNDSARIFVAPALSRYGSALAPECEILRIEATRNSITGVVCAQGGEVSTIRANTVILAAGALESPGILLRSRSDLWPEGLANDSGMVGRNLMRHFIDLYLLRSSVAGRLENRGKELAFNDFYHTAEGKWGSVQSFGRLPPPEMLYDSLKQDIRNGVTPWVAPLLGLAKPFVMGVLKNLVESRMVLASILEDLPYLDNRVRLTENNELAITYRVRMLDNERIKAFRSRMKSMLKGQHFMLIKQTDNNERIAHVCGTCRFGIDPRDSVLDPSCKAHGIQNLYVTDASFFPSSGGTNPALTIAANGLRVAESILKAEA